MRALLALAAAAAVLAGCGTAPSGGAPDGAPAPADLAADAVAALADAGSAHYVLDADLRGNGDAGFDAGLHVEGDASEDAVTAEGSVTFPGGSLAGAVLASEDEIFLRFMGQWYGERETGLGRADDDAPTPDAVREHFNDIFTGSVAGGPDVGGSATWRFQGKLNPDGFADLTERFEEERVTDEQRQLLRRVADHSRFVLDVGRDDDLPRHLRFSLELSAEDVAAVGDAFAGTSLYDLADLDVEATLDLSEFGKDVSYDAPASYRPLDELFDQLFSGLG